MRKIRSLCLICALCVLCFALSGCGSKTSTSDVQMLVQGNLDVIYLDQISEEFLQMVDSTEEDAQQAYKSGLEAGIETAAFYFSIDLDACDDTIPQRLDSIMSRIYSHASYQVGSVTKLETGYLVDVAVYPMDIFQKVVAEDYETAHEEIWQKMDFSTYTDEEYETAWANFLLDLLEARIDQIGYLDAVTVSVHVEQEDDGYYTINEDDFSEVDQNIIWVQ